MKHLKQEFDKLTFKETLIYSMAYLSLITGFVLLFIGLFTEPRGQIHESVITAFGIILVFVGTIMGISMHFANELLQFKGAIPGMIRDMIRDSTAHEPPSAGITSHADKQSPPDNTSRSKSGANSDGTSEIDHAQYLKAVLENTSNPPHGFYVDDTAFIGSAHLGSAPGTDPEIPPEKTIPKP